MLKRSKRAPKTYGDLRRLLAAAGDPWQPDATRSNDEPLPRYPTGGDGRAEPASRTLGRGGVDAILRKATPPANPDLRAVWRDEGLVPLPDEGAGHTSPKRSGGVRGSTT